MTPDPSTDDPLVGQVIASRYRVVRVIGRGGMGAIYEVKHLKLPKSFAMKVLSPLLAKEPEALARFQREADVVAGLQHANVVEITDWETLGDGSPCMIMELLRGEDLADRMRSTGPLPWPFLARVADQVLSALVVAHRAGIVHRDLKPQNIFLAQDDTGDVVAKLLDFGVSKVRHSSHITQEAQLIGTPAYMAPEQADANLEQIGPASDVWAMGAILFEMATGSKAFTAPSTPAVLYRICHGKPEPLTRADAPRAFAELIDRALSHDPARRITTMDELRRGLRAALAALTPGAFVDTMTAPPGDPSLRGPKLESPTTLSRATGQQSAVAARTAPSGPPAGRRWLVPALLGSAALAAGVAWMVLRTHDHKAGPAKAAVAPVPVAAPSEPPLVRPLLAVDAGVLAVTRPDAALATPLAAVPDPAPDRDPVASSDAKRKGGKAHGGHGAKETGAAPVPVPPQVAPPQTGGKPGKPDIPTSKPIDPKDI